MNKTERMQKAFNLGRRDRASDDPEPTPPYAPGTDEYREYVRGFMYETQDNQNR